MVALSRGNVEGDSMVFTIGKDGDERREINLVSRLIKGSICSNGPAGNYTILIET
jgi:phage head maturation protease